MSIRKKILLVFIVVINVLFVACNSNNKPISEEYQKITTKGKVINNVVCKKDIKLNYSLYLLSSYSQDKKFPIIYFFDPHAKGLKVINNYSSIAEKLGFIIAASNNSKNGLSYGETEYIFNTIYDDTYNKLSIDTQRIYTAGFSGGARVASSIAIFKGGVNGVIACGAGFPQVEEPIKHKFNFIGLVGNNDFNFIEMNNLNIALNDIPFPHQLTIFNGKHEWPDVNTMRDAFIWLIFNSMKDKTTPIDNDIINKYVSFNIEIINKREKDIHINYLYERYYKMINYLNGLYEVSNFKQSLDSIANSNEYIEYLKEEKEIKEKEVIKMREYSKYLLSKPVAWWDTEINNLNEAILKNKNYLEVNLNKRLLNYISMICYVTIDKSLKINNVSKTGDFLQIYFKSDPKNPDFKYLTACYFIKLNDEEKAFKVLEEAINEGFDDLDKIKTDKYFSRFELDKKFNQIINKIGK